MAAPDLDLSDNLLRPDLNARRDGLIAATIGVCALLLTLVPYVVGYLSAGKNHFLWLGGNIDDAAVYLSWMRQGESGSLHQYNRFTTDAQPGLFANPLFLALGLLARILRLPLVAVYHIARMGFGVALLVAVWKFIRLTVESSRVRLLAFLFVCFSSGLGWLPITWENFTARATCPPGPIDLWQPEAITFLSLYLNPLFLCGMFLQVLIFMLLLKIERGSGIKCALAAGICGLILALVHSYDILTVGAVWATYLIVKTLFRSRLFPAHHASHITYYVLATGIALPGVLLMVAQLRTNTVFRARASVETLTAYPHWVALGYGLTLALTIYALASQSKIQNPKSKILGYPFLVVWAIINIMIAYLPGVAFQRKLLQGVHFPIAILAGIGAALLIAKYQPDTDRKRFAFAAGLLTLLLGLTNFRFLSDETDRFRANETKTGLHRPTLLPGEVEALDWIAANTPANSAVQPLPWQTLIENPQTNRRAVALTDMTLALFTPALTGRAVYCGHWGETPDYTDRLMKNDLAPFALGRASDAERIAILRRMRVQYLIYSQKDPSDAAADVLFPQFHGHIPLPSYLRLVHSNADADVYFIVLP